MNWPAAVLALHATVQFPVLLPRYVPSVYTADQRTYAIVEERTPSYYSVDLAYDPHCNGAHACSFAHVIGSLKPMKTGFAASACSAYCSDASLTWTQDGAYYRITLSAGSFAQLDAMRKSMRAK